MTETLAAPQVRSMLADHVLDRTEARRLVQASSNDPTRLACLLHAADPSLDENAVATQVTALSFQANDFAFLAVGANQRPDTSHEFIVSLNSEDLSHSDLMADLPPGRGLTQTLHSWEQFPQVLQQVKAHLDEARRQDPQAHVTLDLRVHGNHGTGFKLMGYQKTEEDGHTVQHIAPSVASAAWINAQLAAAGLGAEDVTVLSEACSSGSAYVASKDGYDLSERAHAMIGAFSSALQHRREQLAEDPRANVEVHLPAIFDTEPASGTPDYTWVGLVQGANPGATLPAFIAGETALESFELVSETHGGAVGRSTGTRIPLGVLNRLQESPTAVRSAVKVGDHTASGDFVASRHLAKAQAIIYAQSVAAALRLP